MAAVSVKRSIAIQQEQNAYFSHNLMGLMTKLHDLFVQSTAVEPKGKYSAYYGVHIIWVLVSIKRRG